MTGTEPPVGGEPEHPDEGKHRWLPVGALIFLGVVVVLVLVFVLVRPQWFSQEDDSTSSDTSADVAFHKTLTDIGRTDGVRLSDDNSTSQAFTVPVPVDSTLGEPELTLKGQSQVASSSTVFLRVLADGASVLVRELEQGEHQLSADIALPGDAIEDGSVRIQVRLTGGLDQQQCNLDEDLGALVVLDPDDTSVHGTLDQPLHTVRDVMAGLDHDVTLDLASSKGSKPWFETATALGVALTQAGHDVAYADVTSKLSGNPGSHLLLGPEDSLDDLGWKADQTGSDEGDVPTSVQVGQVDGQAHLAVVEPEASVVPALLTTSALSTADAAGNAPRTVTPELLSGGGVALESLGLDTSVQQVTNSRTWRTSYSLADLPGGTVPTTVQLAVQVPVTSDDTRWLVQVQLNGQAVGSKRLAGSDVSQTVKVPIPAGLEQMRNQLTISLTRDRDLGGCNVRQTAYDVQVLPASRLVLGGSGAGFTAIPAQYSAGFVVDVASSAAEKPSTALAGLVPTLAEFAAWQQQPTFAWDGTASSRAFLHLGEPPSGVQAPIRVTDDRIVAGGLDLQGFTDGVVVQCATAGKVPGLVVTPFGKPGDLVPPYGRETARLVSADGSGAVVTANGRIVTDPPVRAEPAS